jgi:chaperone modulatory protein CbpM
VLLASQLTIPTKEAAMQSSPFIELNEVAQLCQLDQEDLKELLDYGTIPVVASDSDDVCIPSTSLEALRKASQIRRDYALDLFTMAILVNYLERISELERTNSKLRDEVAQCSN